MSTPLTPRKVALGLLTVSILALLVGLFNATRLAQESANAQKAAGGEASSVAAILNKKNHLALVDITGMITMDEGKDNGIFSSESNAMQARKALDAAAKDDSVKGVLLHINTPGGTVAMSQELNAAVQRASKKKPVVVSMGDLTASGGYYTACAADKIIANPGTLTASIGVIISTMDFSTLMKDKLGVQAVTIKSGKFKDILSPYRKPTPEDMTLVQNLVNASYQDFLNTVIAGRTRFINDAKEKANRIAQIKAVADGRVVSGREAVKVGLADEIGDFEHAYDVLDQMAKEKFSLRGKERLPLESAGKQFSLLDFLGVTAMANKALSSANMAAEMLPLSMRYPNQPLWVME